MRGTFFIHEHRTVTLSIECLLKAFVSCLVLLSCFTGCMNVQLQHSDTFSYLDLSLVEKCEYQGREPKYSEAIHIQGGLTRITGDKDYARLSFTDNTKAEYVLLLPMDNTVYSLSIWRDPSDRKADISVRKPVDVILNPTLEKGLKNMRSLLPPESWQGYPSKVVLYNQKDERRIYVAYRKGTGNDDICWSIADASDLNKKSRRVIESVPVPILPLAIVSAVAYSGNRSSDICESHSYYYSVAFSPDGRYALSGSYDNAVKVWDIASGEKLRVFTGHTDAVESVAFSTDGTRVLSGSRDKTVKLWDFSSGALIHTFNGHNKDVKSVAFSPDGRHILSGSQDGTARVWDISSAREIMTFHKTSS
ncbi:MAG: WD domain, G-beta repeat [Syntrophorhabdus sp. PtaU1.Bin153]|nr:MAG: WD domain, G-beta repeat [Syntrophorhabdus sp. PtaU1.Bin153]